VINDANSPGVHDPDCKDPRRSDGDVAVSAASLAGRAVRLIAEGGSLELGPTPFTHPRSGEIVIRNKAVAVNPVDWMTLSVAALFFPWLTYPAILGSDVAGEVVAVGDAVVRFKPGDRVLGHALGTQKLRNNPAEGAFQTYSVVLERMAAHIPASMAFEAAAVLPLGLSTSACGLFLKDQLGLHYPRKDARPTGETVLIWGGASSVGSNAIQLAIAAGYEVIATASEQNFDYVRRLGASLVFDHKNRTVVSDVVRAFKHRTLAGAVAIGVGSAPRCLQIVHRCKGHKFIAMTTPSVSFDKIPQRRGRTAALIPAVARMVSSTGLLIAKARLHGIKAKFVWGSALAENELCNVIYRDFLPSALADRRYIPAPPARVVGHGLDVVPAALEAQRKGVSAQKIVVTL
jgi:NADPH:quinone reductase-like Zn-dependent oxidoreductase